MTSTNYIVPNIGEWIVELGTPPELACMFSIVVDFDSAVSTYGRNGMSLISRHLSDTIECRDVRNEILKGGFATALTVGWHEVCGIGLERDKLVLPIVQVLAKAIATQIPAEVKISYGLCPITEREGLKPEELTAVNWNTLLRSVQIAVAIGGRHSKQSGVFEIDPNSFWAKERRSDNQL